jgi:inosine-uridine nucleoside N-ribohydrolase
MFRTALLLGFVALSCAAQPVRLIFDTDIGNDIDDALALAEIHGLQSRGEVKLLAVTVTKDNPWAPVFVDVINTFYGRGSIPIGAVKDGKTTDDGNYNRVVAERKDSSGKFVYPRHLLDGHQAPDAVRLLRQVLAKEQDGAVTLVQVGFFTNLARLLDTKPDDASPLDGRALVAKKVKLLSVMAGWFPKGEPEYNVKIDLPATRKLVAEWPTPIVASGFEIGDAIRYPAQSIEHDFRWAKNHPVAEAYRAYDKMPYDRQTWDLTAVLYAVRPDAGYFGISPAGRISVDEAGRTTFEENPEVRHRILTVDAAQAARVREAFTWICSQPK